MTKDKCLEDETILLLVELALPLPMPERSGKLKCSDSILPTIESACLRQPTEKRVYIVIGSLEICLSIWLRFGPFLLTVGTTIKVEMNNDDSSLDTELLDHPSVDHF